MAAATATLPSFSLVACTSSSAGGAPEYRSSRVEFCAAAFPSARVSRDSSSRSHVWSSFRDTLAMHFEQPRNTTNLVSAFSGRGLNLRLRRRSYSTSSGRRTSSGAGAAKLPQGVDAPKEEPRLPASFWGFTENAEVWNSRASMIGIFGIIFVEFMAGKGLLEMIGFEVGKGLDLPL
ncbi:hypothetical protein R1sor_023719 [Riccia sorocarpa]|uniref:High light inducible protein n=1 Tax=Riccia sorocarpa TaxID=122646 RepID=A0ABD3GNG4_9MARC